MTDLDKANDVWQSIRPQVNTIAEEMLKAFPPSSRENYSCVPSEHLEGIEYVLTATIAEVIQAYIDAGSERDVTHEELGPEILKHLKEWTEETS